MRRSIVMVAALAVAGAACSGNATSTPTLAPGTTAPTTTAGAASAPPTSTADPPPNTSSAVTSSTSPPDSTIPLPKTEGEDDFTVIWQELMEYHNWAFANPELADPALYLAEACDCLARAEAILAEYLESGWRALGEGIIVHDVDVEVESSTFALMTIVDEQAELTIVGPDGETVEVIPRRPKTFFDVRVRLTDDGWRIAEWNQRGAEGAAE